MRVLFDQNVPRNLQGHLHGHEVTRAIELGWEEFKNGDLLRAAEDLGFDAFITCDQNIRYQQNVAERKLAILELTSNNWPTIRAHIAEITDAVARLRAGDYGTVNCSPSRLQRPKTRFPR